MATLGDPLTDLGAQVMYWPERGAQEPHGTGATSGAVMLLPGFPTRSEAMKRYAEKSGRDVSNLDFYAALAYFQLAVILEGIHARFLEGGTVGPGFETMGAAGAGPDARRARGDGADVGEGASGLGGHGSRSGGSGGTPDRTRTCASSSGGWRSIH